MAEFPALPLWTDAYLADCDHLSDAEHGVYLRLLMLMWRAPECRLPNDDSWLARKMRKSVDDVVTQVRPLIAEFCSSDGNWIIQKRLRKEWSYCRKKSKTQSDNAKSRWKKEKDACDGNAAWHQVGNAPTPTPTPTSNSSLRSELPAKRERKLVSLPDDCPNQEDRDAALAFWRDRGRNDLCDRLEDEIQAFRDHHRSKANRMADWSAAWRTWRQNAMRFTKGNFHGKRTGSSSTATDQHMAGIAEAIRSVRGG